MHNIFYLLLALLFFSPALAETGLHFQSNTEIGNTNADSPRFAWWNPQNDGLPMYGPDTSPADGTADGVTIIWDYYPEQQAGYYTTFFYGCDDDGSGGYTRGPHGGTLFAQGCLNEFGDYVVYGMHPYPRGGGTSTTTHDWEIAGNGDSTGGAVDEGRWHRQAVTVWEDASGYKYHRFYYDLDAGTSTVISANWGQTYGEGSPAASDRVLVWGDAPCAPGWEVGHGIHRGIRIYDKKLSLANIVSESNSALSTSEGAAHIWYMNMNPTPTDISDKSGNGNDPVWNGAVRPTLWAGGGNLDVPSPPTNLQVE